MATASSAGKLAVCAGLVTVVASASMLMILAGGGATASPMSAACGGAGTGQTILRVSLDAEQMGNAQTIVITVATRHLPVYAADITIDTAYTESTLHNSATQTDHDSEGLFQQRVSIYTAAVAADPVNATNAFLDHLVAVADWQTKPVGVDAQDVQISDHPERYQPNAALAEQIVGQLWPAAAAAPAPEPIAGREAAATVNTGPAVCAGAGGAVSTGGTVAGTIVGPTGNNVAGTSTIPVGFTISGSTKGDAAVRFALRQIGKPYVFAAAGPDAYDCSGLTMAAWAAAGVALPHLAAGQVGFGTAEPTDLTEAVSGDLVMIPGADGSAAVPGHVGMVAGYVDADDGRHLYLIQAPMTGLSVELTDATEWSGQIVDVRHIA